MHADAPTGYGVREQEKWSMQQWACSLSSFHQDVTARAVVTLLTLSQISIDKTKARIQIPDQALRPSFLLSATPKTTSRSRHLREFHPWLASHQVEASMEKAFPAAWPFDNGIIKCGFLDRTLLSEAKSHSE